jgi:hypothetical protein
VVAALLERVMERLAPPLEIQEVEGDAVFALGPDRTVGSRTRLLDAFDEAFAAFRARQRELETDESCGCNACRRVGDLDLKIVVHHGRFLRQLVGGRGQVAGADVILAHQLLKNRVGKRAYLLLTEAALDWMGLDAERAELVPHNRAVRAPRRRAVFRDGRRPGRYACRSVMPPSTAIHWPVMLRATSLARKAAS